MAQAELVSRSSIMGFVSQGKKHQSVILSALINTLCFNEQQEQEVYYTWLQ